MVHIISKSPLMETPKQIEKEKIISKRLMNPAGCISFKGTPRNVAGKRQYQAIVSPITTSREQFSPKAKYQMIDTGLDLNNSFSSSLKLPFLLETLNSVVSNVAVPLTAAEPPSPSLLPSPPQCWVANKIVERHRCVDVTQSLMMHLASTGILAAA